jgi:GPH family glycoside/pentoside/hexuronide:cation symporter
MRTEPPKAPIRLTLKEKLFFASGSIAGHASTNIFNQLLVPIYQITLGLNPMLIGLVQTIMRLWDAITDPIVANWSDNTRSRWGRRRPFIFGAGMFVSFFFPIIWLPSTDWSESAIFTYLLISSLVYLTAHTLYYIPYEALGVELTDDYNERTKLYAFRAYIPQILGIGIGWTYAFIQTDMFNGTMDGMRKTSVGIGLLMILTSLIPAIYLKERKPQEIKGKPKISFLKNVKHTLNNQPFIVMMIVLVFASFVSQVFSVMNLYAKIYVIYDGNTRSGAFLHAYSSTIYSVTFLVSILFTSKLAQMYSKKAVLMGAGVMTIVTGFVKLVCYNPNYPYLTLIIPLFSAPIAGVNAYIVSAMMADVAYYDRWKTGERREGMITGISSWLYKFSGSMSGVVSGALLVLIGFDESLAEGQSDFTKRWLVLGLVIGSVVPGLIKVVALLFYKLTPEFMEKCRREVEAREEGEN